MANRKQLNRIESETLSTLRTITPGIFMLDFHVDYALNSLLETGVKDILGMAKFMQKQTKCSAAKLNTRPGEFACSAFTANTAEGSRLMGRNFDYKESPCLVLWTHPENGYRSINTLTVNFMLYGVKHLRLDKQRRPLRLMGSPYVCMDGMNEKGLAIAILEIKAEPTKQNTGKVPVIPPVIVRAVLDKCANVDEAVEQFYKYDMNDLIGVNYHYFIADASGNGAIVEYVDNSINVIRYAAGSENQVLTNYFLSEGGNNERGRGFDRFDDIKNKLECCNHTMNELDAMKLLSENTLYYHHPRYPHWVTTGWSNVFDLTRRTQLVCCGMDYKTAYRFSLDKPLEYERIETGIDFVKTERH